jgi:DNA-binding transcriptional ArsR family regulator
MVTGIRLKEKVKPFTKKMQALGHEHRLGILYLLAYGELPLHELVMDLDQPENLVSHHIKILEQTGWVGKRRDGREVYYHLAQRGFFELFRMLAETPFYRTVLLERLK